jgi:Rrf2 family transcriptional regulator, iron-sulfur cluster assembly transcription factor|tara:strand:+ start:717 stop:1205 length:489 start_codon:yes stop_codon:yes gene_type:complete
MAFLIIKKLMYLTTKGKYAVTAILDMAAHQPKNSFTSISEISVRQNIPLPYLEQIFRILRISGILEAARGPKGGFRLAKNPNKISIGQIVSNLENKMDATSCKGSGNCNQGMSCLTHGLWSDLNKNVENFLYSKTITDVLLSQHTKSVIDRQFNSNKLIARG